MLGEASLLAVIGLVKSLSLGKTFPQSKYLLTYHPQGNDVKQTEFSLVS